MWRLTLILSLLVFLPTLITSSAEGKFPQPPLSCEITSDKEVYQIGEEPKITVKILNNTDNDIVLVKSLDGSEFGNRYPWCLFEVKNTDSNIKITNWPGGFCGNTDSTTESDFISVHPGETFDPFQGRGGFVRYFKNPSQRREFLPKGIYTIQFIYVADESRLEKWFVPGKIDLTNPEKADMIHNLFNQVPKIKVSSNKLKITIQ